MSAAGISYRATLPRTRAGSPQAQRLPPGPLPPPLPPSDEVPLEDVTGVRVDQLIISSPSELLSQLNRAAARVRLWPWLAGAVAVLVLWAGQSTPVVALVAAVLGVPLIAWTFMRDQAARSVPVFYDVNDQPAVRFQALVDAFDRLRSCQRAWHVSAAGTVHTTYQYKTSAGASEVLRRLAAVLNLDGPPVLKTNIAVPSMHTSARSLYFLPDRLLVGEGRKYAEASYGSFALHADAVNFIEDGRAPQDNELVGTTWKYVNVRGGPDRRYKDNRQLPILRYGQITISAATGLHSVWQFSRPDLTAQFATTVWGMSGTD
jgi:DNA polymerase-3 subunit epsilon